MLKGMRIIRGPENDLKMCQPCLYSPFSGILAFSLCQSEPAVKFTVHLYIVLNQGKI